MIREKEIEIFITSRNITFYRDKGYNPITQGDNIMVLISDLNKTCKKKVTAICGCKAEIEIRYEKYLTNYNRHGYYGCRKCSRTKAKKTCQVKYGVDNYSKTNECKEKTAKSNMEKYGVKTTLLEKNTKEKIKKTNLERYGTEEVLASPIIQEKSKQTLLSKYGVDHFSKTDIFKDQYANGLWEKFTLEKLKNYNINEYELDIKNRLITLGCKKNHKYIISSKNLYQRKIIYKSNICTICNPIGSGVSDAENEICDFIKDNYNGEVIQSDRNILDRKEIDIYLPELGLAFEYNGVYWHNELYKDKNYHLDKTEQCSEKGIHLIHIYEDDWNNKKDIIKSRIKNLLGSSNRIYGRNCDIREVVDTKVVGDFLIDNHIQGKIGSKIKLGLYHNNELVSLMCFGGLRKPLGSKLKEGSYELLRFCNKLDTTVTGGAKKLFKYFIENFKPVDILSYADRSWSKDGNNLYENLGFEFINKTVPNYYYVINDIKKNRFNYRKDLLVKEGFDSNKSEHQIMLERGCFRIFDSGSLKYVFSNK